VHSVCTRTCASQSDCPTPESDSLGDAGVLGKPPFTCGSPTPGGPKVCAPSSGRCHGASTIASISGDGQVCSGCRAGVPSDCAPGLFCVFDAHSTERFCSEACTVTVDNTTNTTTDTCPTGTYCFVGSSIGCTTTCTFYGGCSADPNRAAITCYPL
jgi:hypothetical protein